MVAKEHRPIKGGFVEGLLWLLTTLSFRFNHLKSSGVEP